jgi:DNA (cytosine-5)-methyltransferase 1
VDASFNMNEIKYIDMFGGVGGFSLGIGKRAKCVAYYERDKYAVQTYNKNFRTSYKPTDITKLQAEQVPDHDLLCAGFPCQSFSIAGKRKGFSDTRGTMFFEICRIIEYKRPRLVWLENVKGLLNHAEGRTFATILRSLDELGYDAQWQVCNSKHFGVPQNRERVFIIASLRGTSRPKVFPFTNDAEENEIPIKRIAHMEGFRRYNQTYDPSGAIEALDTSSGGGHQPCVPMRWSRTEKGRQFRREAMKQGKDQTPFNEDHRELVPSSEDVVGCLTHALNKDSLLSVAPCLNPNDARKGFSGQNRKSMIKTGMLRRLTPIECERLQGFPDNWTKGVSDTQRYKQMGNAVTVNVIQAIAERLT